MMTQSIPYLEVINKEEIAEAGHRYKQEILQLKNEIKNLGKTGSL
jgi:hypothetical protein